MPSSGPDRRAKEAKVISDLLKRLPNEINGGMVAALIVNILFRYGMYSEWEKIVEAVDETLEDIDSVIAVSPPEVLVN
jgi:hypothetical protein